MANYRRRNYRRPYARPRRAGYAAGRSFERNRASRNNARDFLTQSYGGRGSTGNIGFWGPKYQSASGPQRNLRRVLGYKGEGNYSKMFGNAVRFLPKAIGAVKGAVGGWRQHKANNMRGNGAYEIEEGDAAAAIDGSGNIYGGTETNQLIEGGNAPLQVNSVGDETGDVVFSHREFIGNVVSEGSAFAISEFALNPALSKSFPFLSQLAKYFTLYEFQGLVFEYKPTSGEFGNSSNQLGKVIMATNYDPDAEAFKSSQRMENYDYAVASKPSVPIQHGVETARGQSTLKMMYTRTGEITRDKIFTDVGLFQVATEGLPFAGPIGELWVSYRVKLSRSKIADEVTQGYAMTNTTSTESAPFGIPGAGFTEVKNSYPITFGGTVLSFPSGDSSLLGKSFLFNYTCITPDVTDPSSITFTVGEGIQIETGFFETGGSPTARISEFNNHSLAFVGTIIDTTDIDISLLFSGGGTWPSQPKVSVTIVDVDWT